MMFESFTISLSSFKSVIKGNMALETMLMTDSMCSVSELPYIIRAKAAKTSNEIARQFFDFRFAYGLANNYKENMLHVKMLPLEVAYNQSTVMRIIDFFTIPQEEIFLYSDLQVCIFLDIFRMLQMILFRGYQSTQPQPSVLLVNYLINSS